MKMGFLVAAGLIFGLSAPCYAQNTSTGNATSSGPCSPAITAPGNSFTITCGIDKAQGQKMLTILNKILANQIDPNEVNAKLDEILKAVNPNAATETYECGGVKHMTTPGRSMASDEAVTDGQEMNQLLNRQDFSALLTKSLAEIDARPEWLTPRLFAAMAYLGLNNTGKAKDMLAQFDSKTGPAYNTDGCQRMADFLHQHLN